MRRVASTLLTILVTAFMSAGGVGCSEPDETVAVDVTPAAPVIPAPVGLRRLLGRQYVSSLAMLFGEQAAALAEPPSDFQLHGFDSIGARELALTSFARIPTSF